MSSFRTYEELISPEGREQFATFYLSLAMRKAKDFKALHVLATPEKLVAMDFGVAVDLKFPPHPYAKREWPCRGAMASGCGAELITLADASLALYDPEEVINPLSSTDWWEFWSARMIGMKPVDMEHAARGRAFFILRGRL